jgi:AcrR family transcriptional regulator
MGLREAQTRERGERILDTARKLIRRTGGTAFSMRKLAGAAEVSLATPYNLFASKGGVLYALLNASLDRVDRATHESQAANPVERVLEVAGIAAGVYVDDPAFYRPLMQFLLGVREPSHRPRFIARSLALWTRTVQAAYRPGLLRRSTDVDLLARQLMINFAGVLELWIHEEVSDASFRDQTLYGSTLLLLGASDAAAQPRLQERLEQIGRRLPRELCLTAALQRPPKLRKRQSAA